MSGLRLRSAVRVGLPDGWMLVPRGAGLADLDVAPDVDGLQEVEDLLLTGPPGVELEFEAEDSSGIAVLIQRDGIFSWHIPDPATAPTSVVISVTPGPGAARGLLGEAIAARLRAVVYRFAAEALAGLAARAVIAALEGRRAEGPVHIVGADPNHAMSEL